MVDQAVVPNNIRSDLVDTAIGFLKNPKVATESLEKKREFLQKKGLTDTEIDYAFKIIPHKETNKEIVPNHRPSFLRRILSDLILAGLIAYAYRLIKRWFQSKQSVKTNELNETIKSLQKTVQDMQTSITKLEQAADQLHLTTHSTATNGSLEEIKREIQTLKGLFLGRSQFPSIPQIPPLPPKIPSWQLEAAEKSKSRSSPITTENDSQTTTTTINDDNKDDVDSIIVVSENEKKSDDENQLSISPSTSSSSNDA